MLRRASIPIQLYLLLFKHLTATYPLLIPIYTKNVHVTRLSQGATCTQALPPSFNFYFFCDHMNSVLTVA